MFIINELFCWCRNTKMATGKGYNYLSNVREIIWGAASHNRMDVLEWLHRCMPGGVTAEDCRAENN